eukprot:990341_1
MTTTQSKRPSKQLSDIIVRIEDNKKSDLDLSSITGSISAFQTMIINDWLFLGNCQVAMDIGALNKLGITHVLNCTQNLPCWHAGNDIKYARIPLQDICSSNLYDYFEAACSFIDECNPFYYHQNEQVVSEMMTDLDWKQPKILVHCAAGKSRSSTVVISYLMARRIRMNDIEKNKVRFIAHELDYDYIEKRNKCLRLSEAFYYVKSCRFIVEPNRGFLDQLEQWEQLYHTGNSTKNDIHIDSEIPQKVRHITFADAIAQKKHLTKRTRGSMRDDKHLECSLCIVL